MPVEIISRPRFDSARTDATLSSIPVHDPNRFILHVDMDAFFAAVAVLDNPSLAGKCLLVGGSGNRGVVSTASYEARKFGCHSAMPMARARALCPHAIVVKGDYARYSQLSRQIMDILGHFSPLVQPISIDEAFLDLTGTQALLGEAKDVARRIKTRIKTETGLNASVGVAPNKFLAKLASDLEKPDGLTIIPADRVDEILIPLPITKIWGIGGKTAAKLHDIGVRTIGDLRDRGLEWLRARFGESGDHFHRLAYGIDSREVHPREDAKSIGQEQTFGVDLVSLEEIRRVVLDHCEEVGRRVRRHGYRSARVVVKIRYGNYKTITRSHTLPEPDRFHHGDLRRGAEALRRVGGEIFLARAPHRRAGGFARDARRAATATFRR